MSQIQHLIQDLLAEAHTAREPHRKLMRRAAHRLWDMIETYGDPTDMSVSASDIFGDCVPRSCPIPPPAVENEPCS